MSLTYTNYLEINKLLDLQHPRSEPAEHDESLFIIIHQVYELWFKLVLHEIDKIKLNLTAGDMYGAIATFQRLRTILKTLVSQLDVLETMTPMSFTSFRDRLESASGFESVQFRELEFVLGYKRPEMIAHHEGNPAGQATLQQRLAERSVMDHIYDFLELHGVTIPQMLRDRPVEAPSEPNKDIQKGLLQLYRTKPDVTILLELMTDFDEGFQEWRYRHVKMVERTIGWKRGSGDSEGAMFLRRTLFKPVFPDLWAIRHEL